MTRILGVIGFALLFMGAGPITPRGFPARPSGTRLFGSDPRPGILRLS